MMSVCNSKLIPEEVSITYLSSSRSFNSRRVRDSKENEFKVYDKLEVNKGFLSGIPEKAINNMDRSKK